MIVQFLCGIGILLFGVSVMSSSFEKLCGANFKHKIAKYGNSKAKNALIGFGLDMVMQSSTASVSLIMGLCGAGVLTLAQTIAIMMGTNIASAVSVLWVALQGVNIVSYFGLLIVVGFFIKLFAKSNTMKNFGMCLCGFGLIFCGMAYMGIATKELSSSQGFVDFFFKINNPWILFFLGLLLSALLNSSLGTTAIVASIMTSNPELLSVHNASYIIFAMNVGTCFTLILIGLTSKNKQSLKVSLSYFIFNLVGAIIFCLVSIYDWITPVTLFIGDPTLKIIFVNIIFNVITLAILLPFTNQIAKLLDKIIPDKKQDKFENISSLPTLGYIQLGSNSISYFKETCRTLEYAMDYTKHSSKNRKNIILSHANNMIVMSKEMNKKLFELGGDYSFENEKEMHDINNMFIGIEKANVNIEKLVNSCEYNNKKVKFNENQQSILNEMQKVVLENISLSRTIVSNSLTNGSKIEQQDVQKIVDNMAKITALKVDVKKSIILENNGSSLDKLTCYLNVINYFEEITTNLTDIILSIANIETKKDI